MMKQARSNFRKRMMLQVLGIVLLFFLITFAYDRIVGNELTDYFSYYTIEDDRIQSSEDLQYEISGDDDVLEVQKIWVENQRVYYTLKGVKAGEAFLTIRTDENNTTSELFRVAKNGRITCVYTGNYSNCHFHLLVNVVLLTVFVLVCLVNLLYYRSQIPYSYELMFISGMLIWLSCTVIIQWYAYLQLDLVFEYYERLQSSAYQFMLYTTPVVWIFCISLSVSNISLIRHEGYRPVNALGILISGFLLLGNLTGLVVNNISYSGSSEQARVINIALSSYSSVYSLFACLLEGAIIGGIAAAKHTPSMYCDYIIILGCMIRKDGSLPPLLRGRVDRAVAHGRQQEATTGKKVIYVPSGGQGCNEVMAEGEAMKQYLLSQGIPEEQILVENQSKNTAENMRFSGKLIEDQNPSAKIAFSTTNYHVFRSGIIAAQNGLCPEGMGSKTKWYFWPNAFIREFLGMVFYTKFTIAGILILLISVFAMIETMIVR